MAHNSRGGRARVNAREQTKMMIDGRRSMQFCCDASNRYLFINIKNDDANLGMLLVWLDDILIASINHGKVNIYFDKSRSLPSRQPLLLLAFTLCELNSLSHLVSVSLSTAFFFSVLSNYLPLQSKSISVPESHNWSVAAFFSESFTLSVQVGTSHFNTGKWKYHHYYSYYCP